VDRGQQHREHRQEGGREARSDSDAATRHDEQLGTPFLTKV
jgi:hypothetical protein